MSDQAPDQIERAQVAALLKRLQSGQPLSDAHLEQIRRYQARTAAATQTNQPITQNADPTNTHHRTTDQPTTVGDLATLLGVNRRRISKWRQLDHAPATLDRTEWRQWLIDSGRTKIAARLDLPPLDGLAPETAAAAPESAALTDPRDAEIQRPLPDAGPAVWDKYWKARGSRQDTLDKERASLVEDRDLIPASEVRALLTAMASAMLEALGDRFWLAQRPHLDGAPDLQRKAMRTAHDQAALDLRGALASILREKFSAITNPPAKPA